MTDTKKVTLCLFNVVHRVLESTDSAIIFTIFFPEHTVCCDQKGDKHFHHVSFWYFNADNPYGCMVVASGKRKFISNFPIRRYNAGRGFC